MDKHLDGSTMAYIQTTIGLILSLATLNNTPNMSDLTIKSAIESYMNTPPDLVRSWQGLPPGQEHFPLDSIRFFMKSANRKNPSPQGTKIFNTPVKEIFAMLGQNDQRVEAVYFLVERNDKILSDLIAELGMYHAAMGKGIGGYPGDPTDSAGLSNFGWNFNGFDVTLFKQTMRVNDVDQATSSFFCLAISRPRE